MEGLGTDEIEAERRGSGPLPHAIAQSTQLPLLSLSDRQFEILAHDLLHGAINQTQGYDRVSLLPEGRDRGRDLLLLNGDRLSGVVQCKRKQTVITLKEVLREFLKYCLFAAKDARIGPRGNALRYELWTAGDLAENVRVFFEDAVTAREHLDALTAFEVNAVRGGMVTLAAPEDEDEARREVAAALALARNTTFTHVGPAQITARLRDNTAVRRDFFRLASDSPVRAGVPEVEQLMAARRRVQLEEFARAGAAGANPYVARPSLVDLFDRFLTEPSRIFTLIGGTGLGKTSWAARLLETPPPGWSVDIVRAEDIRPSDINVVETITRLLLAERIGMVTAYDFKQAVWEWVDSGNRILVIDGLDRARSHVRECLEDWMRASASLIKEAFARIVFTSRRETWSNLEAAAETFAGKIFTLSGNSSVSAELSTLGTDDAAAVYVAYGLDPDAHGNRLLSSPSLVRLYAGLKAEGADGIVTRFDVLHRDYQALMRELTSRKDIGKITAGLVMRDIGETLKGAVDGWLPLGFAGSHERALVLDELVLMDRITSQTGGLRLEADDMIEYVLGEALTPEETIEYIAQDRDDPLFVGAVGMMVARLERDDPARVPVFLDRLLELADVNLFDTVNVSARALLEVRSPRQLRAYADRIVALWTQPNLALIINSLGQMIRFIGIPARERLELMWPLACNEEDDDWRDKYWLDPTLPGRLITPFARAAEETVTEVGETSIAFLLEELGRTEPAVRAVARFLLRVAARAAPEAALESSWHRPKLHETIPFQVVSTSVPAFAVRFLCSRYVSDDRGGDVAGRVLDLVVDLVTGEGEHRSYDSAELVTAIGRCRAIAVSPYDSTRLTMASLHLETDPMLCEFLVAQWRHVTDDLYWDALKLVGDEAAQQLFLALIDGSDSHHNLDAVLQQSTYRRFAPGILQASLGALTDLVRKGSNSVPAVAAAVEALLYHVMPDQDAGGSLERLAGELALSGQKDARKPLIYYAGTPADADSADTARREWLLRLLVQEERGENLQILVWKILQSAHARPRTLEDLSDLSSRLGVDPVLKAVRTNRFEPCARSVYEQLAAAQGRSPVMDEST